LCPRRNQGVSDNVKWSSRKKFELGELIINTNRFLCYDKGDNGDLVINPKEAAVVIIIFNEYISGNGAFTIVNDLNYDGVPTAGGKNGITVLSSQY